MTPRGVYPAPGAQIPAAVLMEAQQVYDALGLACAVQLRDEPRLAPAFGETSHDDLDYYTVRLHSGVPVEHMRAVAVHEMRHVWQEEAGMLHMFGFPGRRDELGRLMYDGVIWVRWGQEPWRRWTMAESLGFGYDRRPWEQDAFVFERAWCEGRGIPVSDTTRRHLAAAAEEPTYRDLLALLGTRFD